VATEDDDDLQPITPEDLLLKPAFSLPEQIPDAPLEETPSGPDQLSQFDRRHRDPFTGLLFLGRLEDEVDILGHSFKLVTPSQNERLEAGLVHKKYLNSISSEIGWAAITVATYLRKVDGTDLPQPIGPNDTGIRERFNWVVENLLGPVIQRVYEKCLILDSKVNDAIEELERLGES
jgi:hypothetical protein